MDYSKYILVEIGVGSKPRIWLDSGIAVPLLKICFPDVLLVNQEGWISEGICCPLASVALRDCEMVETDLLLQYLSQKTTLDHSEGR